MDMYSFQQVIPLSYSRVVNNARVTGLTVTVAVTNAATGATLLASTPVPEIAGTGIYTYNWTHGLTQDTICLVTYSVGTGRFPEYIEITSDGTGGRAY